MAIRTSSSPGNRGRPIFVKALLVLGAASLMMPFLAQRASAAGQSRAAIVQAEGTGTAAETETTTAEAFTVTAPEAGAFVPEAGVAFAFTVDTTVAGGTAPYTFTVTGTFPTGLIWDAANQVIRGMPTTTGEAYTIIVTASDATGASGSYTLTGTVALPGTVATEGGTETALAVASELKFDPELAVGQSSALVLKATGGHLPYTWAAPTGLPAGLSFDATNGIIYGIPTAEGAYSIGLSVTDAAPHTATATVTGTVLAAPAVSGTLAVTEGEFLPGVGAPVALALNATGGSGTYTWTLKDGSKLPTGVEPDLANAVIKGTPEILNEAYDFTVVVNDGTNTAELQYSGVVRQASDGSTLTITPLAEAPAFTQGTPVGIVFTATGGVPPYTWSYTGNLPTGLTLDTVNGILYGIPTVADEAYNFTIVVTDSAVPANTASLVIASGTVAAAEVTTIEGAGAIVIGEGTALGSVPVTFKPWIGVPVHIVFAATNGEAPYTWSLSGKALPSGLKFDASHALLSGTPTVAAEAFDFTINVADVESESTGSLHFTGKVGGLGYWTVAKDGGVFSYGDAKFFGSAGNIRLNAPVVGMSSPKNLRGYWLAASDGGVFTYGKVGFLGSLGNIHLNQPVVGMAATPDGHGYYLVASDGGVFAFGNARFYGSTGNLKLNQPVVGMALTSTGHGYYLVAKDGGVFSFGDAKFYGSTGNIKLNQPVVGMEATNHGGGYNLVAADGGIFSYGSAKFYGSTGNMRLNQPVVGMHNLPFDNGYWLVASDGGIFSFGKAHFAGSAGNIRLVAPMTGMENHP